ncbi:MAG: hypothetical protein LEGION0403_FIIPPAGN_01182 [Legionella sp.]|uniref:hypothetical protein n=1 Tax=Legionella sp. TaxID=459 RepID=UPI003D123D0B
MLNRKQTYAMLMLHRRANNFFSTLPIELIQEIRGWANSDIAQALQYAAYARQEDVSALLKMLDENPTLMRQSADVKTPGGDEIRDVTIYEFALGAGDYELARIVQGYFSKINDGQQQMMRQYKRYKPHIEGLLEEKPYDLTPLIDLIMQASAEDVKALLNKDMARKSDLSEAIIQFRKDWAPRILTEPCMHYNYASLRHAFDIFERVREDLCKADANAYDKIILVWRQLIGFEMRRLPGIDRCVMAQGLCYIIEEQEPHSRSYRFENSDSDFPIIASDDVLAGLGSDFAVDGVGEINIVPHPGGSRWPGLAFEELILNKKLKLKELMPTRSVYQLAQCVIC